jgi:hypothetical protein
LPLTVKYGAGDEHLLRRLASAIILQWDALPDELQDLIIDQAVAVEDREGGPQTRGDIESFLRTVKTIGVKKVTVSEGPGEAEA